MRRSPSVPMYTPPDSPVLRASSVRPAELEQLPQKARPTGRRKNKKRPLRRKVLLFIVVVVALLALVTWGPCYFLYDTADVDFSYLGVTDTCKFFNQLTAERREIHRKLVRDYVGMLLFKSSLF
eukprot:TRINITY_DN8090_c0_g1_i1.p1 TRINITY_DN8090_c0_g1~~TRINITY_DN8090_c0_g1_i1.p1  ORF type:complete len:124 (+),score=8.22 TRINITY_DN8090_c0_g1_i1:72-443(+)